MVGITRSKVILLKSTFSVEACVISLDPVRSIYSFKTFFLYQVAIGREWRDFSNLRSVRRGGGLHVRAVRLRHSDPHLFMEKIRCDLMVTRSSPKTIGAGGVNPWISRRFVDFNNFPRDPNGRVHWVNRCPPWQVRIFIEPTTVASGTFEWKHGQDLWLWKSSGISWMNMPLRMIMKKYENTAEMFFKFKGTCLILFVW